MMINIDIEFYVGKLIYLIYCKANASLVLCREHTVAAPTSIDRKWKPDLGCSSPKSILQYTTVFPKQIFQIHCLRDCLLKSTCMSVPSEKLLHIEEFGKHFASCPKLIWVKKKLLIPFHISSSLYVLMVYIILYVYQKLHYQIVCFICWFNISFFLG